MSQLGPISEPSARISFKFHLLWLLLDYSQRQFLLLFFLQVFFFFVNIIPYGREHFETLLLLQIATESFQTFPEFSSQWSSQNYIRDF